VSEPANVIIVPPGTSPDMQSLDKHPGTVYLYNRWGRFTVMSDVKEALKELGPQATNPESWIKYLTDRGFEKEDSWYSNINVLVLPEESRITFGPPQGGFEIPHFTFKEFQSMPISTLDYLSDVVLEQAYLEKLRKEASPYFHSQRADEKASLFVAGIPLLLAGVGGAVAYLKNRNAGQ
jgi:hypothetical protein